MLLSMRSKGTSRGAVYILVEKNGGLKHNLYRSCIPEIYMLLAGFTNEYFHHRIILSQK